MTWTRSGESAGGGDGGERSGTAHRRLRVWPYRGEVVDLRLLTARPDPVAQLLRGALESEGIDVVVQRDAIASVYGLSTGSHATRLLVPSDQLDAARRILADLDDGSA